MKDAVDGQVQQPPEVELASSMNSGSSVIDQACLSETHGSDHAAQIGLLIRRGAQFVENATVYETKIACIVRKTMFTQGIQEPIK